MQFILRHDTKKLFYFAALQSPIARELLKQHQISNEEINTIYYLEDHLIYTESDAALKIAEKLPFPIYLCASFKVIPKFIRNNLYRWVSKNRFKFFGKTTSCWLPSQELLEKDLSNNSQQP
jgi:predicted DCC family thiol-disulfide oxidoreductase YuxK